MVMVCRFISAGGVPNGVSRVLIGKAGTPTFGALAVSGFGFEVRNLTIWIVRHDGTTLSETSTGVTLTTNVTCDIGIESDGAGNLSVLINGAAYGPYAGAPSVNTSDARTVSMEAGNGGDANFQVLDPVHLAISAQ
jgi:hypothetical protein